MARPADSTIDPIKRFTLIIPTYNRSVDLARLLGMLALHRAQFRILVLDSSREDVQAENARAAARLELALRIVTFDPSTPPFDKFAAGAELVETEYAAMCADDDLVVPGSLSTILQFLDERPDYSAAHGWYFSFDFGQNIDISTIVYRGDPLDAAEPLRRLHECFRRYEALTYAVYRSPVLKQALGQTRKVDSIMAKELIGSAVAAVYGKVGRLPLYYYGRSLAPSQSYANWVPVHFLARSPASLFEAYLQYRPALIESLQASGFVAAAGEDLASILDLIHLRYLADYAKPALVDDLIAGKFAGEPPDRVAKNSLPLLVDPRTPLEHFARHSRWLRKLRNRVIPNVRLVQLKRVLPHRKIESTTASGRARQYRFAREFLTAVNPQRPLRDGLMDLIHVFDRYV